MASTNRSWGVLDPLTNITSYHVMMFGTLLGTELFQVWFHLIDQNARADHYVDLRYDQSVLQRAAYVDIYHFAEACLSRIFSHAIPPPLIHRHHTPSSRASVSR